MSYGVAKAGVLALSVQLRAELHNKGVQVSLVCPAFFKTNLCENVRSGDGGRMKHVAEKLMEQARESADDIAAEVFEQARRGNFMIIPTATERRRWRLKRFLPNYYFRKLLQMAQVRAMAARD